MNRAEDTLEATVCYDYGGNSCSFITPRPPLAERTPQTTPPAAIELEREQRILRNNAELRRLGLGGGILGALRFQAPIVKQPRKQRQRIPQAPTRVSRRLTAMAQAQAAAKTAPATAGAPRQVKKSPCPAACGFWTTWLKQFEILNSVSSRRCSSQSQLASTRSHSLPRWLTSQHPNL